MIVSTDQDLHPASMVSSDLLEEAGGYFALGMFSEAWEATEELPPEERTSEPALAISACVLCFGSDLLSMFDKRSLLARSRLIASRVLCFGS